jgi:hypothetical protein
LCDVPVCISSEDPRSCTVHGSNYVGMKKDQSVQLSGNGRPVFMYKSNLCCSIPFKDLVATLDLLDFWTKPSSYVIEDFQENHISFVAS